MGRRASLQTTVWLIGFGAVLFIAAGNWAWPQAWLFLAEVEISSVMVCFWLARHDPALLESRLSRPFHGDQKPWDRVFLALALPGYVAWLVLMALDARRFGWSHVPLWAQGLGAVLIALCMVLVWQVFRFNSFAAPQVRIQADRGQRVVTEGPYRLIRHPMYAAALLYFLGAPLLLGSWWGLLPVPFFMVGLGARAAGEERMLRQALPDYDDYARRVRFRLVPGVW
ncbi:MAG TPA: isoprenylcysteine carboxylmethyltransferase family protein [Rhodopila sp.]|jgi:protein-S-isoprenylcysteine O-methyltransferase Ste14|nr:isoprenylcysteine carboxylmethyltransferase family protein [Rhodopila sp.]